MFVNNSKRKGHFNCNSKMSRSKFHSEQEKITMYDGLYGNLRMMYAAASLVGCVVQVQVRSGAVFEGVLRTFSHQFDVVLEMAHKVNNKSQLVKGVSPTVQNLISSFPFEGEVYEKFVLKQSDIILLKACNVDADYAVKDNFTDKAISKFDGQIKERELEPWEGADSDSENTAVIIEDENDINGWDANDMFRTNAEKYGVKSSYDHTLSEYTVPLTKKDTEEYKKQEAKATKIAYEIEASNSHQAQFLLENGDEEDRFSSVMRPPEDSVSSKYILPQKRRNLSGLKRQSPITPLPPLCMASSMAYSSLYTDTNENGQYLHNTTLGKQLSPEYFRNSALSHASNPVTPSLLPTITKDGMIKIPVRDGIIEKSASVLNSSNTENVPVLTGLPEMQMVCSQNVLVSVTENSGENEKFCRLKGEADEIEELRKFGSCFKLSIENKKLNDIEGGYRCSDIKADQADLIHDVERLKINNDDKSADVLKYSNLNPNAKEFVFNPNAKSFTPPVQSQSPVMHVPQSQMMQQPIFTALAPQYVMQATPVSVAPFIAASQAARFHKATLPTQPSIPMQYSSSSGVMHASGPHQQALRYPQMNFVVGSPVMSPPQPIGLSPAEHTVPYCETSHVPAHIIMPAHPGVPLSATSHHSLQQCPPQSQTTFVHPSMSPVHQMSTPHSQPPTPPSVIYAGSTFGQHSLETMGPHSQSHPGFSSGSHSVVLMQAVPTSLHAQHSVHMHSQNPGCHVGTTVHMLSQMTSASAKTAISGSSFIQHP